MKEERLICSPIRFFIIIGENCILLLGGKWNCLRIVLVIASERERARSLASDEKCYPSICRGAVLGTG